MPISSATKVGLLIAYWCTLSFWGTTVLLMSLLSRNVAGQTKKSVSTASLFLAWAVGNMIGPQVFQSKDAPRYFTCFSVHMGCYIAIIILLGALRWHLKRENNKRDLLQVSRPRIKGSSITGLNSRCSRKMTGELPRPIWITLSMI